MGFGYYQNLKRKHIVYSVEIMIHIVHAIEDSGSMVLQKVIRVNEPWITVRSRKGKTYDCVVNPDVSMSKVLGYLSQGFNVDAHVSFPHGTATVTSVLVVTPEIRTVTPEELEEQKIEYEAFADY
jgi:hypothetical protein